MCPSLGTETRSGLSKGEILDVTAMKRIATVLAKLKKIAEEVDAERVCDFPKTSQHARRPLSGVTTDKRMPTNQSSVVAAVGSQLLHISDEMDR